MIIKPDQRTNETREQMRGGAGHVKLSHAAKGGGLPKNVRLASVITLEPGCSIGWHVHEKETEIFYFVSGSGIVSDNGASVPVAAGDCMMTPDGCGHSVENNGGVPLVLFAVIVLN